MDFIGPDEMNLLSQVPDGPHVRHRRLQFRRRRISSRPYIFRTLFEITLLSDTQSR